MCENFFFLSCVVKRNIFWKYFAVLIFFSSFFFPHISQHSLVPCSSINFFLSSPFPFAILKFLQIITKKSVCSFVLCSLTIWSINVALFQIYRFYLDSCTFSPFSFLAQSTVLGCFWKWKFLALSKFILHGMSLPILGFHI